MTTFERVRKVLLDQLHPTQAGVITAETRLAEDLGADSLDQVEVVLGLEDEFGIEILDEEIAGLTTVAEIVAAIDRKLAS